MKTLKIIGIIVLLLIAAYFGWYIYRIAVGLMFAGILFAGVYIGYQISKMMKK
jgi:hypothetical protein